MARRRQSDKGSIPRRDSAAAEAEALLAAGHIPESLRAFRLIHELNPTGHDLPGHEARWRYLLKSRLQSLLIRCCGDSLAVEEDAASPGIVGLRHRLLDVDACHARMVDLDVEARRWVERQIASSIGSGATAAAELRSPPGDSPRELVAAAAEALSAYDYGEAEALARRACHRSGGAAFAVVLLLELLVDHLSDEATALELASRLTGRAAADPGVRALAAIAAARLGQLELVPGWLEGCEHGRAAEAHALLAAGALAKDELQVTAAAQQQLRDLSGTAALASVVEMHMVDRRQRPRTTVPQLT